MPKKISIKKIAIFLEINEKWLFIQGVKKEFIVQHPAFFLPFLKDPADKLRPHSQISFKSWLNNVGSELGFCLLKSILWWLEKVGFQTS